MPVVTAGTPQAMEWYKSNGESRPFMVFQVSMA